MFITIENPHGIAITIGLEGTKRISKVINKFCNDSFVFANQRIHRILLGLERIIHEISGKRREIQLFTWQN